MAHHSVQPKTKVATIKLTPDQYRLIDQRAKKVGVRMSAWMRAVLTHAATRQPDSDGYIRIREPDGVTT